nr:receptor-like kinase TMK2 [Procambarus clarkii]
MIDGLASIDFTASDPQVSRKLGSGISGTVYLVIDEDTWRCVKVGNADTSPAELAEEGKVLLHLAGAGGAPILYGKCLDPQALVISYCGSCTFQNLRSLVKTDHGCIRMILQLAQALAEVHSKMIIHNDLKDENVVIRQGKLGKWPEVSIIDYGIAKRLGQVTAGIEGETNSNFPWIAPEMFKYGAVCTRAVDVYSLGNLIHSTVHRSMKGKYPELERLAEKASSRCPTDRPSLTHIINVLLNLERRTDPKRNRLPPPGAEYRPSNPEI